MKTNPKPDGNKTLVSGKTYHIYVSETVDEKTLILKMGKGKQVI